MFERARLKQLFSVRGTQAKPVSSIVFSGLGLTGTQSIVLDPHGVPSGGDWSLSRTGALFLEGTERVVIEHCVLQRLDGNGILLSGYNRHANISHNTIVQTGATAIALWGDSSGTHPAQPAGTGPDGTAGDFPRYTLVESNFIHELGIHSKQSACFFQAKSAQTTLRRNICFDVPRAGFNLNVRQLLTRGLACRAPYCPISCCMSYWYLTDTLYLVRALDHVWCVGNASYRRMVSAEATISLPTCCSRRVARAATTPQSTAGTGKATSRMSRLGNRRSYRPLPRSMATLLLVMETLMEVGIYRLFFSRCVWLVILLVDACFPYYQALRVTLAVTDR